MRSNTRSSFVDLFIVRIGALMLLVGVITGLWTVLIPTVQVLSVQTCAPGSHLVGGQCTPDPVRASLDTTDAAAGGTDVLPVSFHDAPADLWNAMREVTPGFYDDDVPGIGTFYVPVGSSYDVPGGLYLATSDGWAQCRDTDQVQECSATGPVTMLDIPTRTAASVYDYHTNGNRDAQCGGDAQCAALDRDRAQAALGTMTVGAQDSPRVVNVAHTTATDRPARVSRQCVKAARDILRASLSRHLRVEEDLSYVGMTSRVGKCNDTLATALYASGYELHGRHNHKELRTFLRHVIRTSALPTGSSRA